MRLMLLQISVISFVMAGSVFFFAYSTELLTAPHFVVSALQKQIKVFHVTSVKTVIITNIDLFVCLSGHLQKGSS